MRERTYSYKPQPRFFGSGDVYLGVELEVEAPTREAKTEGLALRSPRWGYAKHDGSLASTGWELVTHPISLGGWLSQADVRDYHNVPVGTTLTARYKGQTYTATQRAGGKVEWNGVEYNSISMAARAIAGGKHHSGYEFFGLTRRGGGGETDAATQFFGLVAELRRLGYQSHNGGRCGFHVHISRKAFSPNGDLHNPMFFRFKALINGQLFRKLSQRESFNFSVQTRVDRDNFDWNAYGRHVAVNIPRNGQTVEVRIFRGNLREDRLRKNLEAVIAALEFAREATDYTDPTDDQFKAFVAAHAERFANLQAYINNPTEGGI